MPSQSVLWDIILNSTNNLASLAYFGYSTFPLSDTVPSHSTRFGPSHEDDNDSEGGEDQDQEAKNDNDDLTGELLDAMEPLEAFVKELARRCPQLMHVAIAGPRGYEIAENHLVFHVDRREKEENDEESEEEIVIESDIRMYK